jgi:hypothetical protein
LGISLSAASPMNRALGDISAVPFRQLLERLSVEPH